ncbi:hypothetical protein VTO73DRAFT_9710 [Trametes versicolor]
MSNYEDDSEDVRNFLTMGGQVSWAVHAYRYLDATRSGGPSQELPQVVEDAATANDDAIFDAYMHMDALVEEWHDTTASVSPPVTMDQSAQPSPISESTPRGPREASIVVDYQPAFVPVSEMHAAQVAQASQHTSTVQAHSDATSLSRASYGTTPHTRTLSGTQVTAEPSHATVASTNDPNDAATLPAYKCTPDGAFSMSAETRKYVRERASHAPQPQANAGASSSSVKVEDIDDAEAFGTLASQAGPSRTRAKGKSVARHAPYKPPTAPAPAAPLTTGSRYNPNNPPPGWAPHYTASWMATWTWDGDKIPEEWGLHDLWGQLKAKYNLCGSKPCGWKGCAKGPTIELRKHVLGVHLGCTYKCRGCKYVYTDRFDNWRCRPPAEGVHGAGCLTAKFWRGQIKEQDLEEALKEREEAEDGSLAEV